MPKENRAMVQGVNMVIRHTRQSQTEQGGRIPKEASIDLSNLAMVDPKDGGATRVGFKEVDGKKVRYAKKSGEVIDA
jgi:large subunit ribosomal protein L24